MAARSETLIEQGYRQMYNMQFDEAHRTFAAWQAANPDDPVGPASDAAAYLFTEFDRLHILQSEFFVHEEHFYTDHRLTPDSAMKQKFEAELDKSVTLANRAPEEPNSRFALVLSHGLRSDYLGLIEKRYLAAFNAARTRAVSVQNARHSFRSASGKFSSPVLSHSEDHPERGWRLSTSMASRWR